MFPGGFHYHQRHSFMKKMLKGETDTYLFHMSWTCKCFTVSFELEHTEGHPELAPVPLLFIRSKQKRQIAILPSVGRVVCRGEVHRRIGHRDFGYNLAQR